MISESEYDAEVREQARHLEDAVEGTSASKLGAVMDVLDGHKWFNTNRGLDGQSFGAIIDDFDTFNGNVENYRDPTTFTRGSFNDVLEKMAFAQFEADVITAYESGDY